MPLKTPHTNNQFIRELVQLNVLFHNKGKFHHKSVFSVHFEQVVGFSLKEPLQRICILINLIGKGFKGFITQYFSLK